jgi:hypothetical protein
VGAPKAAASSICLAVRSPARCYRDDSRLTIRITRAVWSSRRAARRSVSLR